MWSRTSLHLARNRREVAARHAALSATAASVALLVANWSKAWLDTVVAMLVTVPALTSWSRAVWLRDLPARMSSMMASRSSGASAFGMVLPLRVLAAVAGALRVILPCRVGQFSDGDVPCAETRHH